MTDCSEQISRSEGKEREGIRKKRREMPFSEMLKDGQKTGPSKSLPSSSKKTLRPFFPDFDEEGKPTPRHNTFTTPPQPAPCPLCITQKLEFKIQKTINTVTPPNPRVIICHNMSTMMR